LPVPREGTRQVPPLRREPYADLRRVSHEQCPERSQHRDRRVPARRLLLIELYGPQAVATTLAHMDEPVPVAYIVQLLDASI
jgi:hypothetical protein